MTSAILDQQPLKKPVCEASEVEISIVIPCYNAEKWVRRAIDSVLAQEGASAEIIVIDDGSTDGSVQALRPYEDSIYWETGANQGACAARNRGLELAQAAHLMFLDADDYVEGPFLASALDALKTSRAEVAFGCIDTECGKKRNTFALPNCESAADVMHGFLSKGFIPPCGTVWSTAFVRSVGGWKENIRRHQDYELTFRALSSNPSVCCFEGGRGVYFQHETGNRISTRTDLDTVRDQAWAIRFVGDCIAQSGIPEDEKVRLMQKRAYHLWQQTCRSGNLDAMKIGRDLYGEFGGTGHIGSLVHRTVASLVGLPAKEWIALRVSASLRFTRWRLFSGRKA